MEFGRWPVESNTILFGGAEENAKFLPHKQRKTFETVTRGVGPWLKSCQWNKKKKKTHDILSIKADKRGSVKTRGKSQHA